MTKSKKIISCMLAFAAFVSAGSCNGGGRTETGNSTASTTAAVTTGTTIDDDVDNPVDVGDITLNVTDLDTTDIAGTTIKYLGVYDPTKAGDVKPAYKYFVENYDATMEIEICPDSVCVHGDSPKALLFVRKIRAALEAEGIAIQPL